MTFVVPVENAVEFAIIVGGAGLYLGSQLCNGFRRNGREVFFRHAKKQEAKLPADFKDIDVKPVNVEGIKNWRPDSGSHPNSAPTPPIGG